MSALKLKNPIVFFDLETTGTNIGTDRIVEIWLLKISPNGQEDLIKRRVNPEMKISKEASEITGIKDEDVKDCPTFKEIAQEIVSFIEGCDFAGFNSNRFDVPVLCEELHRAEVKIDLHKRKFIDVQAIYHKKEQRTLSAAYKFYCGKDLINAHGAEADTMATYEVLKAQIDQYDDLENDVEFLSKYSSFNNNVDFAGTMIYNEKGEEVFNIGKHKGQLVRDVLKREPAYLSWVLNNKFTADTKEMLIKIKNSMVSTK